MSCSNSGGRCSRHRGWALLGLAAFACVHLFDASALAEPQGKGKLGTHSHTDGGASKAKGTMRPAKSSRQNKRAPTRSPNLPAPDSAPNSETAAPAPLAPAPQAGTPDAMQTPEPVEHAPPAVAEPSPADTPVTRSDGHQAPEKPSQGDVPNFKDRWLGNDAKPAEGTQPSPLPSSPPATLAPANSADAPTVSPAAKPEVQDASPAGPGSTPNMPASPEAGRAAPDKPDQVQQGAGERGSEQPPTAEPPKTDEPTRPVLSGPTQEGATEPAPDAPSACKRAGFRIVIDVGHTKKDYGALSARNKPEFDFNLRLANELLAKLQKAGFAESVMVVQPGDNDLGKRVRELNNHRPDLMLSLHHDSVQDQYLQSGTLEGQPRTFTTYARGYSVFISRENANLEESKQFARELGRQLRSAGLTPTMHHNEKIPGENRPIFDPSAGVLFYDKLVVLRLTTAPAVLLESAVITEPDDERRAEDPAYRTRITDAIVAATDRYCATSQSQTHSRVVSETPTKKPGKR